MKKEMYQHRPRSPIFSISHHLYEKIHHKHPKSKQVSIFPQIFKRNKLHKKRFLSMENFSTYTSNLKSYKSSPDFIMENFYHEPYNFTSKVYSDLYFKHNKPLFGYFISPDEITYTNENISIFNNENFTLRKRNFEYMPILEFTREESNLKFDYECDSHLKLLSDISGREPETKKDITYNESYRNYVPLITYNIFKNNLSDENIVFDFFEKTNRVCLNYCFFLNKKKIPKSNVNLDEISPVENENVTIGNPRSIKKLSDKSLDEIEKILLERKKIEMKKEAEKSKNQFLLEPLLLEEVPKKHIDNKITISEHKKIIRFSIMYTLAFFALAIVTFFIVYLA